MVLKNATKDNTLLKILCHVYKDVLKNLPLATCQMSKKWLVPRGWSSSRMYLVICLWRSVTMVPILTPILSAHFTDLTRPSFSIKFDLKLVSLFCKIKGIDVNQLKPNAIFLQKCLFMIVTFPAKSWLVYKWSLLSVSNVSLYSCRLSFSSETLLSSTVTTLHSAVPSPCSRISFIFCSACDGSAEHVFSSHVHVFAQMSQQLCSFITTRWEVVMGG